jgi:thioredoxin 1
MSHGASDGGAVSSEAIVILNEENFDKHVAAATQPILVDFWADWCPPCKAIAPTLEQLAAEMHGRAQVAKINVDDNGDLANRFAVRSIPTLMVFKDGKVVDQMVGNAPKEQIRRMLERHLA